MAREDLGDSCRNRGLDGVVRAAVQCGEDCAKGGVGFVPAGDVGVAECGTEGGADVLEGCVSAVEENEEEVFSGAFGALALDGEQAFEGGFVGDRGWRHLLHLDLRLTTPAAPIRNGTFSWWRVHPSLERRGLFTDCSIGS